MLSQLRAAAVSLGLFTVLTGVAYPLYLAVLDTAVAATIWARRMPSASPGLLVPERQPVPVSRGEV